MVNSKSGLVNLPSDSVLLEIRFVLEVVRITGAVKPEINAYYNGLNGADTGLAVVDSNEKNNIKYVSALFKDGSTRVISLPGISS